MTGIVDSHVHVWQLDRGDYGWLTPELSAIYRDFALDDVWQDAAASGVRQVILVQAAPTLAETRFLLDCAAADRRVAGVIGWIDFAAPDAVRRLEAFAAEPKSCGVRPMIGDIPDPRWILDRAFAPAMEAMARLGLVLDAHARPDHLAILDELADRFPALSIAVDHAAKPPIGQPAMIRWKQGIARLSERANVICKYSGLMTQISRNADPRMLDDVVDHLIACFGPARMIWGSDWPYMCIASDYNTWMKQSMQMLSRLNTDDIALVFEQNAVQVYKLMQRNG